MIQLTGRQKEIKLLKSLLKSGKSEFVAVYGRRRVGKTFLVRRVFADQFAFHITGMANATTKMQLGQFHAEMAQRSGSEDSQPPGDWFNAFRQLIAYLEKIEKKEKKIVFFDELPWLDTRASKFISGLEHFWNSWASARDDIILIVCGSAASWMINNLINNRGGLYNRITQRIKLEPFNLAETEQFLKNKNATFNRYQIILFYMVFGGIPFYLEQIKPYLSAVQNINELCFEKNAPFRKEYTNLYASLFYKSERHVAVVEALATKNKGLDREGIIKLSKLSDGGGLSRILEELEESSFIRRYRSFGKNKKNNLFQLVDLYSLFYLNFIKKSSPDDESFWVNIMDTPLFLSWSGYAFEMVCLHHVRQIKKALGINGIQSSIYSWQNRNAQIDLLIDRKDQVVNLCEMKFSTQPFAINKKYAQNIGNKIASFKEATNTKKAIFLTMVTTYGILQNNYSGMVQNDLTMDVLFAD